ncbi:MAG TPA: polysaccharide biosynthesis/export family protein [Chitinispirillaceae bacterium]|nr:polysaccharide biosynthesis/export family protein [Chitinispirillaceae bacterium]
MNLYHKSIFMSFMCILLISATSFSQTMQQNNVNVFNAGDGLRISVPLDSTSFINGIYPIDGNGDIFLPIIGQYHVANQNPEEIEGFLKKAYEQYLHYPEIQVTPLIRVGLLGGFNRSGMYYVEPHRSMWDLISMAGGTVHEKGLKKMHWERDRKVLNKNLIPYLESGKSLQSIGFKSGDQVWTPTNNRSFGEILVRDVLPVATFFLSFYVGIMTIRD